VRDRGDAEVERRVYLLRKIAATAANQLGSLDRALSAQARALKEDPSQGETLLELEHLAGQAGAWDKLRGIYNQVAGSLDEPALARQYWMRLAAIEERLVCRTGAGALSVGVWASNGRAVRSQIAMSTCCRTG